MRWTVPALTVRVAPKIPGRLPNGNHDDRAGYVEELGSGAWRRRERGVGTFASSLAERFSRSLQAWSRVSSALKLGKAHFWTRELAKLGHDVRLMQARLCAGIRKRLPASRLIGIPRKRTISAREVRQDDQANVVGARQ